MRRAFSLVELMIVVALLGILAAMAMPSFRDYTSTARAATAKDNIRIFRSQIKVYAAQHRGVPPGYASSDSSGNPRETYVIRGLTMASTEDGQFQLPGTPGYDLGPYIRRIPENPFNNSKRIYIVSNNQSVPANATGQYGWIYQPITETVKLDWPGIDKEGIRYYDY